MVRKLNLIIVIFTFMLLVPSHLYARGGSGSGRSGVSLGSLILSIFDRSPYDTTSNLTPAAKSHGILQINVTPEDAKIYKDAEIYVDGRFIGLVRDFKGSAMVSVPSGNHVVEFRGSSFPTASVDVVPGSITLIVR